MKFAAMMSLVCVLVQLMVMTAVAADRLDAIHWRLYKKKFAKAYANSSEESMRRSIFLANRRSIEEHNGQQESSGYKLGYSHLSDWTSNELSTLNGIKLEKAADHFGRAAMGANEWPEPLKSMLEVDLKDLPAEVDWRTSGRVGPVEWQGHCASDWAFATTGVLEGQQVRFNISDVIPLSVQDVMDCSPSCRDCDGGFMADALADISHTGGIESDDDYPYRWPEYHSAHHLCHFNKSKSVLSIKGGRLLPKSSDALQKVVAQFGPVAAGVHATHNFINYKHGVLNDTRCAPGYLNHAVLLVGYGTMDNKDYWLVKNSWSEAWGDNGYIKIARDHDCGLTAVATVPEF